MGAYRGAGRPEATALIERLVDQAALELGIDVGDLHLTRGHAISGRVLDDLGQPLAGVEVQVRGPADPKPAQADSASAGSDYGRAETTTTNDQGRFQVPDQAPGRYVLLAQGDHVTHASRTVDLGPDADLLGQDLRLRRVRTLKVVLQDDQGKPIEEGDFEASWHDGSIHGDKGEVSVPVDAKGLVVALHFYGEGEHLDPDPVPVPEDATEVRIVVRTGVVVAGTLVDEAGVSIARGWLSARRGGEFFPLKFDGELRHCYINFKMWNMEF